MREGFLENLSLNLGPKLDSSIEPDAAKVVSVVWSISVEETSRSKSTLGAVEMMLAEANAEEVVLVGAGHGNEDATVSTAQPGRSEVGERRVSTSEAGEKGAPRPGERDRARSRVVLS